MKAFSKHALRENGVDVVLDQWDLRLGGDLPRFMESGLSDADRVLAICTGQYVQKANKGTGGVGYEKMILTAQVMGDAKTKKIIPIIRDNQLEQPVPVFLSSRKYIDFRDDLAHESKYVELLHEIHGHKIKPRPPLGKNPFLALPAQVDPLISFGSERYASAALSGTVTFDYSNNNGHYVLGAGETAFETKWSRGSNLAIHVYSDAPSIRNLALALGVTNIADVTDVSRYDTTSRVRTPQLGTIVLWQNIAGYYLATKVEKLLSRMHGDPKDEITFSYAIQPNKTATFGDGFRIATALQGDEAQDRSSGMTSERSENAMGSDVDEEFFGIQSNFRQDGLIQTLKRGGELFNAVVKERALKLPEHGGFEAAVWIWGDKKKNSANASFLNLIASSNPHYTGWPFWVDSSAFSKKAHKPYVSNMGWQALIADLEGNRFENIDFWRAQPDGVFYHRRALEDDIIAPVRQKLQPFTLLDWCLVLWRVGEVIGTGLRFARAMGCPTHNTEVGFMFRWTRLKGRELISWTEPGRSLMSIERAHDDSVHSRITVPLESADTSIYLYVHEATKPLFELFGGKEIQKGLVESVISRMFTRKDERHVKSQA